MTPLLDTHQHLIYPQIASYSWTNGSPYLAGKSFTLQEYELASKGLNIQQSLFMEAGVDEDCYKAETDFVAKLASDRANNIIGLIATCRPETVQGFERWIEDTSQLGVVGYRRVIQNQPDEMSQDSEFRKNIQKIGDRGKVFDVCVRAHQIWVARDLAMACDNTKMVLNHCGNPDIINDEIESWSKDISELAELPNMFCKLSGVLPKSVNGQFDYTSMTPYVEHLLETFGPERIVWGSDWPVVNRAGGLGLWGQATYDLLSRLSDVEAWAIAHGNAKRIYGV